MLPDPVDPFYYLDNFERVLDWIAQRYADLLIEEEADFLTRFRTLPRSARALLVRMVMRKGSVFRTSKLNYAEIGCAHAAAQPLLAAGWVRPDPVLELDHLFDLLSKPEIAAAFSLSPQQQALRKAEQLEALRASHADARPYSAWARTSTDQALQIDVKPLCDRLRLIFFGNAHQDWVDVVLADLGVVNYEQVAFSALSRGFRHRRDVEDYLHLQQCRERFQEDDVESEELDALPALRYDNPWLDSQRRRLLFQLAQRWEKQQDWARARQLYAQCDFPGARARMIRVLEKDNNHDAAYALAQAALAQPESEAEQQQVLRMLPRLARKLGQPPPLARPASPVDDFTLMLPLPQQDWVVEYVVRDHLTEVEAPVFYVENTLVNGLFGLLCWGAIFAAIPGAFFHPFHHGPADLRSDDFVRRRQHAFATCLAQLDSGAYRATIRAMLAAKRDIASPFVAWGWLPDELVEMALDCIPATHIRRWCERILLDIHSNRSGFPDLIQFWPAERRYRMIEVKGPGDRLQDNQLRWIDYFARHQMPVAVCYLQWSDA